MKTRHKSIVSILLAGALTPATAILAQSYWDANGTDAGSSSSANGGGTGNWNNSTPDWWVSGNTDVPWSPNNIANFAGSAGIVTVQANVVADALYFSTAGYTINSSGGFTLTLTNGTPLIALPSGGTETIGAVIAGTNGLIVSNNGTLILSGANTYTGGILLTNGSTVSINSLADSGTSALGPYNASATNNLLLGGGNLIYTGPNTATGRPVIISAGTSDNLDIPNGVTLTLTNSVKSGTLTLVDTGTLVLGGTYDNSGLLLNVNAGTVLINKTSTSTNHGVGSGLSTLASGAELKLAGSGNYDIYSASQWTVSGGGLVDLGGQSNSMSTLTISGTGFGAGGLINSSSSPAALTNGGSGFVLAGNLTIGGTGPITLGSKITDNGGGFSITDADAGLLTLAGSGGTFSGGVNINTGGSVMVTAGAYTSGLPSGGAGTGPVTITGNGIFGISNITTLPNTVTGGSSSTMNIYLASANEWLTNSLANFAGTYNVYYANPSVANGQLVVGNGAGITASINSSAIWNIYPGSVVDFNGGQTDPAQVNLYGIPYAAAAGGALRLDNSVQSGNVTLYANSEIGNESGAGSSTVTGVINDVNPGYGFVNMGADGTVLEGVNTYRGATVISNGTLGLALAGSIANSSSITLASGTTFDVSQISGGAYDGANGYQLQSGQTLSNINGSVTINGNLDATSHSPLKLVYTTGTPLTVNNGLLDLSENPVTVNITPGLGFIGGGGVPIVLINNATGDVSTSPVTVNIPNTGYSAGNAPTIFMDGNELYLTVNSPVVTGYSPLTYSNLFIYVGGVPPLFSVTANGAGSYQWYSNGVPVSGATASTYQYVTGTLPAGKLTNSCVVQGSGGWTTNFWVLNVVSTNSYMSNNVLVTYPPYPLAVLQSTNAAGVTIPPVSYWRLDEADNGLANGNAGTPVNDWLGGNLGTYTGVDLGSNGYSPLLDPTETAADFGVYTSTVGGSTANIPVSPNINFATAGQTVNFSVECWVNAAKANVKAYSALVSQGIYANNDSFVLAINSGGSTTDRYYRFYVGGTGHSVSTVTSTTTASGAWQHLVGVCNESAGTLSLYINGVSIGSVSISSTAGFDNNSAPILFGYETGTPSGDGQWNGLIDDVAIYNYALPASVIAAHYNAKGTPPSVTIISSTNVDAGAPFTISPSLESGTQPLTNMWVDSNASFAIVSTNQTLSVASATTDKYILYVSNAFSPPATTNIVSVNAISGAPSFASPGFNITPPSQDVYVGTPVTFSVLAYGSYPITYQWYNGNGPIPGATGATFTTNAPLGTTTYYCEAANSFTPLAVSATATLVGAARPVSLYPLTVLSNGPIAYWRLDEQPDNQSGNTGTIAHDYVGGHNLSYNGVVLDQPGDNASNQNPAALFGNYTSPNSYAGEINQSSSGIPVVDLETYLVGNSPEFTVEAWVKSSQSQSSGAGILAKGYGGGGEQFALACVNDTFEFYFYEASSDTLVGCVSAVSDTDGNWHHLVGIADTIGNVYAAGGHLYIDGADAADGYGQAGKGLEDSTGATDPAANLVSIGSRASSKTQSVLDDQFVGEIQDVAIYTYPLSPAQIAADYAAGTNTTYIAQPVSFAITKVKSVPATGVTITWNSQSNFVYQVQVAPTLTKPMNWSNLGSPVTASGTTTSYTDTSTNATSGLGAYYQVLVNGYQPGY